MVACDVRTRFVDAAEHFAPQKGASPAQVRLLRARLEALVQAYRNDYGVDVADLEGGGAAGGLAGGLAIVGAQLLSGFELIAEETGLYERIEGADLVITGEGYLDDESVQQVFIRRRDDRISSGRARLAPKRSFAGRVRELAAILDEDGYLASFDEVGRDRFLVTEHNCAIQSVASQQPLACRSELEFLRAALPEAEIERTSHIVAGQTCCAYRVTRRTTA